MYLSLWYKGKLEAPFSHETETIKLDFKQPDLLEVGEIELDYN